MFVVIFVNLDYIIFIFFFFQAEDGIRDGRVTGVQTCALPICEIRQRRLVKEALRMRPNRLIVGEVRQEEALDLLIALNSGIAGMTSLHANSAREALDKLTTLPLLAGQNISHGFIVPAVAAAIDL